MGFTVEDMLLVSRDRYRMKLEAGRAGWSNSVSWLMMLEDITITHNFTGKELAVTTGLGFKTEQKLLSLAEELVRTHASGLLINTGKYIKELPKQLIAYCDENELPLLTVPWDVVLADMVKDLSIRIFLQGDTDVQISEALIQAIEEPDARDHYLRHLLPYFDVDGTFQVILFHMENLDKMDTVERRRLSYRLHLYLTNLTHNAHFFYYDSVFVLIINALEEDVVKEIIRRFRQNFHRRMPGRPLTIGVSDPVYDVSRIHLAYNRARAALSMALDTHTEIQYFSDMGLYRLLYSVSDRALLKQISTQMLGPLLEYDRTHEGSYVPTLEAYLASGCSIQAVSDTLFTHRNTVSYRMNNIRRLLGCPLDTTEEKMMYYMACLILHMHTACGPLSFSDIP